MKWESWDFMTDRPADIEAAVERFSVDKVDALLKRADILLECDNTPKAISDVKQLRCDVYELLRHYPSDQTQLRRHIERNICYGLQMEMIDPAALDVSQTANALAAFLKTYLPVHRIAEGKEYFEVMLDNAML